MKIEIDNTKIGEKYPPYIVAEMSANHNGDIKNALNIIKEAKVCGANAIKMQTYTADTLTFNSRHDDFMIKGGLWNGLSLYELYEKAHMPWSWQKELFAYAKDVDITIFSSPFDKTAVDFLENLDAPAYKIASFEAIDISLIKYVASTKKPLIISTGMANKDEIHEAVEAAKDGGCDQLMILHCVSGYPAPSEEYNLKTITDMREFFGIPVGLSDHTIDNITAISSISYGACLIEKHFTLDRKNGGPDDSFSIEPKELKRLCIDTEKAWKAKGKINYKKTNTENQNVIFRRSLYVVKDILKGQNLTEENIKSIRPGYGLSPKFFDSCIGKQATQNIKAGTALTRDHFK